MKASENLTGKNGEKFYYIILLTIKKIIHFYKRNGIFIKFLFHLCYNKEAI